ncbi:linker for activation of T-cells family member 2 isoform X3 [Enhydra lutris kenyoni]|uniref:Linker for activation of T-cells family member 2 isoform X3 n=1 Tax=Enhydra lutris kenyoni TaxID=391180 RepID=A0A2Y9JA08_ENHLU|nr:linker for activation of T-cells family member 2 isoform X3 [Enhydra lutris kenyoni]
MVLTKALPDMWPGVDMNVESELLWPGVALLLLLGTVASLCVRCSRPAVKKSEKIYEQRSPEENQQNFAVARTYSLVRQAWPGALVDMDSDVALTRKDKLLRFSPSLEGTRLGPRSGPDAAHTAPISMDYYNWGQFRKPQEDDDNEDANSYENVLICTQKEPDSGDEGSEDYQNSASIRQWRESRRAVERAPREEPLTLAGSPDDDGDDPDYVNQSVAATEA